MSYEIVRNLSIRNENGKYFARLNTTSNNVRPYDYHYWNYGAYDNKAELEKDLLLDFFFGNLQGGSSKYQKTVQLLSYNSDLLKHYRRLDKLCSMAWHRNYNTKSESRKEELRALEHKLYTMKKQEAREVLYRFMNSKPKPIRFTVQCKNGCYVKKINKNTYRIGSSSVPIVFTSPLIWARIRNSEWWNENFIITQLD